ncbi:carboxylesterase family protein [Parabacteroides sp. PF5-9]|uniref:carboxylesterase/lipase family protein n=1 Tax=Parabacteroides sp. PF5-9 TaxID=1742404 RepID=UPI0024737BB7|nr:carboxylesterase family protein [Parabacteroides sp. PF5-9]MDH6358520.1 para-nitrobenzyl esterase [Parabacteroides sp. PF5-9]
MNSNLFHPLLFAFVICLSLLFIQCQEKKSSSLGHVSVEGGVVSGKMTSSPDVMLFAGVPYAAPPTGDLRWREPQPVIPWEGVKTATEFPKICPQYGMEPGSFYEKEFYQDGLPETSEDCLYLNVWTPAKSNQEKLPVVMWVHGGAFDHGWGHELEFDGDAFARKGVILVTINYRVGVFGFMAHPWLDEESPKNVSGNYAILDQVAALKWIRNNISGFGGDPDKITIMGQSAGARSMMALLATPLTKGLIHGAIIQSGGGYRRGRPMPTLQEQETGCIAFADYLGAKNLEELRTVPAIQLMDSRNRFNTERRENNESGFAFSTNIDDYVFPEDIDVCLDNGNQHLIPAIIGYNSQDGSPENLKRAATEWSTIRISQEQPNTYIYLFQRQMPGDDAGAFHSAELWYMFGTLERSWRPFTIQDRTLSEKMIDYWSNFIKTGNPNGKNLERWTPYDNEQKFIKILDIE